MEPIYLILILFLFLLAISDLIVGVSNDAEIEMSSKNEVRRIREELTGNRSSILFMSMLQETRNMVYFSTQVMQSLIK
ncbi:MAG: hypothetical protein R6W85_12445 [Gillisia sp.]